MCTADRSPGKMQPLSIGYLIDTLSYIEDTLGRIRLCNNARFLPGCLNVTW